MYPSTQTEAPSRGAWGRKLRKGPKHVKPLQLPQWTLACHGPAPPRPLTAFALRHPYATPIDHQGRFCSACQVSDTRVPPPPAGTKHAVSPGRLSVPPTAPRQAPLRRPQLQALTSAPTSLRSGIGEEKQNEETPENRSGTRAAARFLQRARRAALTAQAAGRGPAGPWRRTASRRSGRKPRLGKRPAPHFRR